jgi:precorrin-6B methylase 1
MPVIKCSNGKWRIGSGLCKYDTKEKAQEVYVSIISSGSLAAQGNKVSFDFDDTLSTQRGQDIAKRLIDEGKTIYIITRRQETDSKEVYKVADELGIPHSRVYFTNGALKWETIKRLEIGTHYDNNQNEVDKIRENTDAKAIKF